MEKIEWIWHFDFSRTKNANNQDPYFFHKYCVLIVSVAVHRILFFAFTRRNNAMRCEYWNVITIFHTLDCTYVKSIEGCDTVLAFIELLFSCSSSSFNTSSYLIWNVCQLCKLFFLSTIANIVRAYVCLVPDWYHFAILSSCNHPVHSSACVSEYSRMTKKISFSKLFRIKSSVGVLLSSLVGKSNSSSSKF